MSKTVKEIIDFIEEQINSETDNMNECGFTTDNHMFTASQAAREALFIVMGFIKEDE